MDKTQGGYTTLGSVWIWELVLVTGTVWSTHLLPLLPSLFRSGIVSGSSMGQINLFKNHLYLIGPCKIIKNTKTL